MPSTARPGVQRMRFYRDPLLHFAVAGAVLFAGYILINRNETDTPPTDPVRIGEGEVRWLKETFANQWQRTPTDDELRGLVAALLEEELLAREAKTLGLDQNDTIVRRRLAQKLAFLVDDTSRVAEPSDEELRQFYNKNAERFRIEPRLSFTQIFFNPERRQHAEKDAKAALVLISTASGDDRATTMGDPTSLETEFRDVDAQTISNLFGADFARTVSLLKRGSWAGPLKSGYGVHLVRIAALRPATLRPFEEVRPKVLEEWRRQREGQTKAQYLGKLREKYGVVIDDSVSPLLPASLPEAKTQ
jgi:hypothetical protein